MGVYIKGVEAPEDCRDCGLEMYYMHCGQSRCRATNRELARDYKPLPEGKPDWCPLVEVKEPHGDLIDKKELAKKMREGQRTSKMKVWAILTELAPTVIEGSDT